MAMLLGNWSSRCRNQTYEAWKLLRKEAPVYWFDRLPGAPFWTITRHADIVSISRQPKLFANAPRLVVGGQGDEDNWQLIFDWTNQIIGASDPEYRQADKSAVETLTSGRLALFEYFQELTEDRRKIP